MFYDLSVPYKDGFDVRILTLLSQLGYGTIALEVNVRGSSSNIRLPTIDLSRLPRSPQLRILTRCTLHMEDGMEQQLSKAVESYDIVAVKPLSNVAFVAACNSNVVDMISLDTAKQFNLTQRRVAIRAALSRGIRFEICYAAGMRNVQARIALIRYASHLIRFMKGRGILISSGAQEGCDLRGPYDIINMALIWGMKASQAQTALADEPQQCLSVAYSRRMTYSGAIGFLDTGLQRQNKGDDTASHRERGKRNISDIS